MPMKLAPQLSPMENSRRKLIGYKYPLDSEFGVKLAKFCTFAKSKKEFKHPRNDNPAPNAYRVERADQHLKRREPGVVFGKQKKKFYGDEIPRTLTPGPIYTYKKSVLSNL